MQSSSTYLPCYKTNAFSALVTDYISGKNELKDFYAHPPTIEGIKQAIESRKQFQTNRNLLLQIFTEQYKGIELTVKQQQYLQELSNENCFTVTTAHQPNIFTGHLYFIYKILHAVKLAETLTQQIDGVSFVPVYYMGSEDADLDELGHIYINGQKYEWTTKQTGAVGRMKVDDALIKMLHEVSGQVTVLPYGIELMEIMKECYTKGTTIEQATFKLVNKLFASYGLLVLLPDSAAVKGAFSSVIEKELLSQFSHKEVEATVTAFPSQYKVQASGRDINLFYLRDNIRERIEWNNDRFTVVNTDYSFTKDELIKELKTNPERFSPNVILRPVLQETILPNIAFIGGGGELAYWMELKKVFEAVNVPYPVLVLRNSFALIEKETNDLIEKLQLTDEALFLPAFDLAGMLVKRQTNNQVALEEEKKQLQLYYHHLATIAAKIDKTLEQHTIALQTKAAKKIDELEKKLLRAEKKRYEAELRQLDKIKLQLFPNNNLQERVENFASFYAKWGSDFIDAIYQHSLSLEQQFGIIRLF